MGNKRNTEEIERDRKEAMSLALQGMNGVEIAAIINSKRSYSLTSRQVRYDIQHVRTGWQKSQLENYEMYINQELDRVDVAEKEAWNAWRKSGGEISHKVITELARSHDDTDLFVQQVVTTLRDSVGNPRFLEIIHKLQIERRKLLGVYAPTRFGLDIHKREEIIIKGYAKVSPDLWPDNESAVIEAEYEE